MSAFKYLDISLLVAAGIFVALAGLPLVGYLFVAGAWIAGRAVGEYLEHRAEAQDADLRTRLGMHFAGMMARVLIVVSAVIAARYVGDREDGVMAAVLALAVFTVYLGSSAVARQLERNVVRP
jgi:Kef-type K+ transport system membrane component KefB